MIFKSEKIREYVPFVLLASFWLFALMNPVFKKYDYGGGFPLIIGLGVVVLVVAIFEFGRKREKNLWEQVFLAIFAVAVVISFFLSEMRSFGLSEVLAFLSVVAVYLLFSNRKVPWIGGFLKVAAAGGIFAVVVGMILYVSHAEVRMFGPFFNKLYPGHVWPNAFALFLVMVWPLYLVFLRKRSSLETAFILSLMFSSILLSFSRGAFIVLCGQLILLGLYYFRRIKFKTILSAFLTAVLTVGLFFGINELRLKNYPVVDVGARAGFENYEDVVSAHERLDFWEGALELTGERPFFGWGPFSFKHAYNPIQKEFLASADHPHNIFLKISSENGLIALGAFFAFLLFWFGTVAVRFGGLDKKHKDLVFILGVSVAGAFAHNMIDYNFNFVAPLLLLFLFMAFIRSIVVEKENKVRKSYISLVLAILVAVVSLYEGGVLVRQYTTDANALEKSFFPRNYHVNEAKNSIEAGDHAEALRLLEKEVSLSPLNAEARYLKGVVYCDEGVEGRDDFLCGKYLASALELNPMNELKFYYDYFVHLEKTKSQEFHPALESIKELLEDYFFYVEYNVHFTSYTDNVEVAANLVDAIVPHLSEEEAAFFIDGKEQMLKTSARQRSKIESL